MCSQRRAGARSADQHQNFLHSGILLHPHHPNNLWHVTLIRAQACGAKSNASSAHRLPARDGFTRATSKAQAPSHHHARRRARRLHFRIRRQEQPGICATACNRYSSSQADLRSSVPTFSRLWLRGSWVACSQQINSDRQRPSRGVKS
jgi:hypothetical protein